MRNGAHEGYPGLRILQIRDNLIKNGYLNRKPNVVLMHMGTNNCVQRLDVDRGADDIESLANYILEQSPGVTIILSTLSRLADPTADYLCQHTLNPGIREKVIKMQIEGKKVYLADIGADIYYIFDDISKDGIHPGNRGYEKIAEIWYERIHWLDKKTSFHRRSTQNSLTSSRIMALAAISARK